MRRTRKNPDKKKGFSLVEVLVALMIFTIGIMAIISLQGIAFMATDYSGQAGMGRILALDQLERLGGLVYTANELDDCGGTPFCYQDAGGGVPGTGTNINTLGQASSAGRFRREWDVDEASASGFTPAIKTVTVRVRWSDVKGGPSNVTATSFNRKIQISTGKVDL